jgi:aspartyl/asparaginyl beta-hydroxylase (cupin superfamily)
MFYDKEQFPFTSALEANWHKVRAELDRLPPASFVPWPEQFLYEGRWDVFGLYSFGRKLAANCALCPDTTELVEDIPGMTTAGFSWLQPGARIAPHRGYTNQVLRCHLGLVVPADCGLRVGGVTTEWREGQTFIFDDTVEHEAWNRSAKPRIVLLLDFLNPR